MVQVVIRLVLLNYNILKNNEKCILLRTCSQELNAYDIPEPYNKIIEEGIGFNNDNYNNVTS